MGLHAWDHISLQPQDQNSCTVVAYGKELQNNQRRVGHDGSSGLVNVTGGRSARLAD
eukprot:CAMPEP_0174338366 /NCGR_PEP_ID=MMETSP0810-20121108/23077_1 /TAXON_ID=73025 ORGANISM="Eutreptiella gymnastica-like, Strain CCMP1594" /NCGR_SAMPLE_ID=MMETSP0810 /ASSEMBLY_ACC=CAM_ASM_000659 /LENGTH=56 /DNA_ID=CAMNT_0015458405 /DNA_START=31 /DNA_END=201 /DNA_ORIENTATION=+